jgi:hypothetical protein
VTARWARALGVAAMPVVLYGCAQQVIVVEPAPRGRDVARPGRPGFVIAAPASSADLAADLARRTGFGLVVASGAGAFEGVFEDRVRDAARGPLAFYAEIHARREAPGRIDIATVGVDAGLAARLRTLYELIRDAHLRAHPGAPRVDAVVVPAEARAGTGRLAPRALHLELPRAAREPYLTILAEFLTEAAALPAGR